MIMPKLPKPRKRTSTKQRLDPIQLPIEEMPLSEFIKMVKSEYGVTPELARAGNVTESHTRKGRETLETPFQQPEISENKPLWEVVFQRLKTRVT